MSYRFVGRGPAPFWVLVLFLGGLAPSHGEVLQPPTSLERPMAGGEVHQYRVIAPDEGTLRIAVDQRGVDVVVETVDAADNQLTVDGPNGRHGVESLTVPAAAGTLRLEIRSSATAAGGSYRLDIEVLTSDSPSEARRLAAEEASSRGALLYREGTREAWRQALVAYDEALDYFRTEGPPRETARLFYVVAVIRRKLDELDQAHQALEQARASWRQAEDDHGLGRTLNEIGYVAWLGGDHLPALDAYERALTIRDKTGDLADKATTLNNIGLLHLSTGRPRLALEVLHRALELCTQTGEESLAATVVNNMGGAYQTLGEPHEAREYFERALDHHQKHGNQRSEARAWINLGQIHRKLSDYRIALAHYLEALQVVRTIEDRRGETTVLNNLGRVHLDLGEPQRALGYFSDALTLRRRLGDRRGEATTLHNLGQTHERLEDTIEALDVYHQALNLRQELGDLRGEAVTLNDMGTLYAALGDANRATEKLERALELRRELGDAAQEAKTLRQLALLDLDRAAKETDSGASETDTGARKANVNAIAAAETRLQRALELHHERDDREGEAETLHALARTKMQRGHFAEAIVDLDKALGILESLRVGIASSDLQATFQGDKRDIYLTALEAHWQLHRRDPEAGHDRQALELSERARTRSLVALLRESNVQAPGDELSELRIRQERLQQRLNAKASRERRLLGRSDSASIEQAVSLRREIEEILTTLQTLEAEIRIQNPAYGDLVDPEPLSASQIQALLGDDTLLLEYALGEARSFLWAVDATSVEIFELPGRGEIDIATRRLYQQWSTLDARGERAQAETAATLGDLLLGPVAARLDGQRLVVVADGALHYLPFAALPHPQQRDGQTEPLLAAHEVVSLPSMRVLDAQRRALAGRRPAPRAAAVLADPVFDRRDPRIPSPTPTRELEESELLHSGFDRLAATRDEAAILAELIPAEQLLSASDADASRALAVDGSLADYRLVHFATHGILDSQRPALSGLVLSLVDDTGQATEGFLHLHDIYDLRLGADLVVLSGCQTALGKEVRGEGLLGLTRGFLHAGARAVMASLWQVRDRATAELVTRFYRALLVDDQRPAAALRRAQLEMLRETSWKDPYYWAVFILQGDWR